MMILDPYYDDPYGGGGGGTGGGDTGDGGYPTGDTGGTDPYNPPTYRPTPHGWWVFIGGVWKWMTEGAPRTVQSG